jgi:hypothetical protein
MRRSDFRTPGMLRVTVRRILVKGLSLNYLRAREWAEFAGKLLKQLILISGSAYTPLKRGVIERVTKWSVSVKRARTFPTRGFNEIRPRPESFRGEKRRVNETPERFVESASVISVQFCSRDRLAAQGTWPHISDSSIWEESGHPRVSQLARF